MVSLWNKYRKRIFSILITLFALALSLLWWVPLVWALGVSLSPSGVKTSDFWKIVTPPYTLEHFKYVLDNPNAHMMRWFSNSLIISVCTVGGMLILVTFAGYAFSKIDFKFKGFWFWVIMASVMVPGEATLVSSYVLHHELGLLNTLSSLILPGLASAFSLLLMKSFIDGIPGELFEAATIDGCSRLRAIFVLVIPLTRMALASLGIFSFLSSWNNYLWPFITISDTKIMPIAVGISYFTGQGTTAMNPAMAASLMACVPVLVIFFVFQRQITKGIAFTGLKM